MRAVPSFEKIAHYFQLAANIPPTVGVGGCWRCFARSRRPLAVDYLVVAAAVIAIIYQQIVIKVINFAIVVGQEVVAGSLELPSRLIIVVVIIIVVIIIARVRITILGQLGLVMT